MEEGKINGQICTQQLDAPELIQHIQSLLPVKEAARTSFLSKSWLHAWSTIPNLRFCQYEERLSNKQKKKYISLICRTLGRYHRNNLPITSFDLEFSIQDKKSDSLTNKWVQKVASKSCLKDLHLKLNFVKITSFTLIDEIFSGENLHHLSVTCVSVKYFDIKTDSLLIIGSNPVIKCVSLRVLKLCKVNISEEVLHNLLSTCSLLENINLSYLKGSKMPIKAKNLPYLRELKILTYVGAGDVLEIYDLPNLHTLIYDLSFSCIRECLLFKTDSLGSLRELSLEYVAIDDSFVDIIKSKFPFLESLTLGIGGCRLSVVDITCVSLRFLTILIVDLSKDMQIELQVFAPNLKKFHYKGRAVPRLLFSPVAPHQIQLTLALSSLMDQSFFLKMRELLNFPSKFNINIRSSCSDYCRVAFNVDDVPVPASNVEKLTFWIFSDKGVVDYSLLFDAFFSILHPKYMKACQFKCRNNELIARAMMELKTRKEYLPHLKDVEIQDCFDGNWETLTSSWTSSPNGLACLDRSSVKFKLTWCSL